MTQESLKPITVTLAKGSLIHLLELIDEEIGSSFGAGQEYWVGLGYSIREQLHEAENLLPGSEPGCRENLAPPGSKEGR